MQKLSKLGDITPTMKSTHVVLFLQWLNHAGYEHYEISNFAKPGFQSRHNSSYWQGKKYLGIGPSAHSFNGISRQWNVSNNNTYITSLKKNKVPFEMELLNIHQQMNEYIMTSLRSMEGVQLDYFESKFGKQEKERLLRSAQKYIETGRMLFSVTGSLLLTNEGKLFADGIASDLFVLNKDPGES